MRTVAARPNNAFPVFLAVFLPRFAACAFILVTPSALARTPAQHSQTTSQSFHDAVAEAWSRLPQRRDLASQQSAAGARYAAGGALFPNAPYAVGTYFNDKVLGSNYNYLTAQAELGTPIWLPGEGTATQATARADSAAVVAAVEAAHLALAAQVLDLASQAALAANTRDVAARRLTTAQSLAGDLAHRFQVGESSQSDALAASSDAATAVATLSSADAQLAGARAALAVVVGNDLLPRLDAPAMPPLVRHDAGALSAHPRIVEVWRQLAREEIKAARCTVARLMRTMGLHGVIRGKKVRTTIPGPAAAYPLDHVNRQFRAPRPNALWVSDFTYVATWSGFVYVAFVIDAFARRIVGWRVSRTAHASFVLDTLEQALHQRRPVRDDGLVHHSDRGSQYLALHYTDRLAEAGVQPSVGSVGDSYHNALAETINGLFKAEVIHRRSPWRGMEAVEFATLEWVDWFNNRRLLEPIGNIPPAEAEARYYAQTEAQALAA